VIEEQVPIAVEYRRIAGRSCQRSCRPDCCVELGGTRVLDGSAPSPGERHGGLGRYGGMELLGSLLSQRAR
jgi:hypothetical protein